MRSVKGYFPRHFDEWYWKLQKTGTETPVFARKITKLLATFFTSPTAVSASDKMQKTLVRQKWYCQKFNGMGILNPSTYKKQKGFTYSSRSSTNDGLWVFSTLTSMLKNREYLGHMVQGREKVKSYKIHDRVRLPKSEWVIVEDTHEAIIEKAIFDKAQALQKRDTRTANGSNSVHMFAGFLKCIESIQRMDVINTP